MIKEAIIHFEYFEPSTLRNSNFLQRMINIPKYYPIIKMEANFTKYIVSKLNALGICDEELDENSLENIPKVSSKCQKGLDQIFQTAAKSGNFPLCKYMLQNMGNLNPVDEEKATAFHYAAENGHWEICCLIIKNLKHKNPANVLGFTPLHLAAQNGHLKICQLILGNVHDKNPKALGWTPLHFAAQKGQFEVCKLILGYITEKNPKNMCGQTPKSLAIENGHQEIGDLIDEAMNFNQDLPWFQLNVCY